ncbi:MAG: double-strand break repair helicase AddA [Minwuia sp.]|nr:double-strand break repair helicase AddA [Minwuia sp.]
MTGSRPPVDAPVDLDVTIGRQRRAANPLTSAWVSANAGSGKTRVLTDRVVRLLLAGTEPNRILSLTFTKAAAAEMENRLFDRLGRWAALSNEKLRGELKDLVGSDVGEDISLDTARRLFARALETPGGLKIQTIHAFASAVLGRFPLEAGISPEFRVMDDIQANAIKTALKDNLLAGHGRPEAVVAAMARLVDRLPDTEFDSLLNSALWRRDRLSEALQRHGGPDGTVAALRRNLGLGPDETEEAVLASGCRDGHFDALGLRRAMQALQQDRKGVVAQRSAGLLSAWLASDDAGRRTMFDDYCTIYLTQTAEPKARLLSKAAEKADPSALDPMLAEQDRICVLADRRRAAALADMTHDFLTLAGVLLDGYSAAKARRGMLDHDDLILRLRDLLRKDRGWVHYKLDQGIDHILIDEAQDTSPAQWDIARELSEEFFVGHGAREATRTVFAVGDEKQSIYSFQGADPKGFQTNRDWFANRVHDVGEGFAPIDLQLSFRSTTAILTAVDHTLSGARATGLTADGTPPRHHVFRQATPGLVELWPLVEPVERQEGNRWDAPQDQEQEDSPRRRLAKQIAARIAGMIRDRETIGDGPDGSRPMRPIRAGDVMILVRKRDALVVEISRALKAENVPVAGSDRMRLTEQIAVMDLMVLGDFLLLPEDDLALATVLKSPLYGFDDDADLFPLAHGRGKASLWSSLRSHAAQQPHWQAAIDELSDLLGQVDLLPPFEFYSRLLGQRGGRKRLVRRLGPDQIDPLDEFLQAALNDEGHGPASMQGFLHRLRQQDAEIKRDMDHGRDAVRIMTVHGAKGLEAPVVFLPDTGRPPQAPRDRLVFLDNDAGGLPLVTGTRAESPIALETHRDRVMQDQIAEYRRLLYVAMTRAEDRLYVCGCFTSSRNVPNEDSWYRMVQAGLQDAGAVAVDAAGTLVLGEVAAALPSGQTDLPPDLTLPAWVTAPIPEEPVPPRPLSPSRPSEMEPAVRSPLFHGGSGALQRGVLIHYLLQVLPTLPVEQRQTRGETLLRRRLAGMSPGLDAKAAEQMAAALIAEALAVMDAPALAALFGTGSRAEVAITGLVDGVVVTGQVDRLLISDDRIIVADYKTNRPPPQDVADVSTAYLRQMALYRSVLQQLHGDRPVEAILVWTDEARSMSLPDALLDQVLRPAP